MSNRANAARFSQGPGGYSGLAGLDLFGFRERKANRMADRELERDKQYQQYLSTLNISEAEKQALLEQKKVEHAVTADLAKSLGIPVAQVQAILPFLLSRTRNRLGAEVGAQTGETPAGLSQDYLDAVKRGVISTETAPYYNNISKIQELLKVGPGQVSHLPNDITAPPMSLQTFAGPNPIEESVKRGGYIGPDGTFNPEQEMTRRTWGGSTQTHRAPPNFGKDATDPRAALREKLQAARDKSQIRQNAGPFTPNINGIPLNLDTMPQPKLNPWTDQGLMFREPNTKRDLSPEEQQLIIQMLTNNPAFRSY